MIKGLEHSSCEQRQRAGTVQPRKEKAQGVSYLCIQMTEGRK